MTSTMQLNNLARLSLFFITGSSLCLSYSINTSRYLSFRKKTKYSIIPQIIIHTMPSVFPLKKGSDNPNCRWIVPSTIIKNIIKRHQCAPQARSMDPK